MYIYTHTHTRDSSLIIQYLVCAEKGVRFIGNGTSAGDCRPVSDDYSDRLVPIRVFFYPIRVDVQGLPHFVTGQ